MPSPAVIRFPCPKCGTQLSAPEACAGRSSKCQACGQPVTVPALVRYTCPRCKKSLESPASFAGQKLNCPDCNQRLQIPQTSAPPPPPPPPINRTVLALEESNPPPPVADRSPRWGVPGWVWLAGGVAAGVVVVVMVGVVLAARNGSRPKTPDSPPVVAKNHGGDDKVKADEEQKKKENEEQKKAKDEADKKAKEEADKKKKEDDDKKAKDDADKKAKEEADKKAKEEADKKKEEDYKKNKDKEKDKPERTVVVKDTPLDEKGKGKDEGVVSLISSVLGLISSIIGYLGSRRANRHGEKAGCGAIVLILGGVLLLLVGVLAGCAGLGGYIAYRQQIAPPRSPSESGAAVRADDDVPSFKKRGDKEKEFVSQVGTAIVKAARTANKIELDDYKYTEPKKDRKDLTIKMNWQGAITEKKYTSDIVVKIDSSDDKKWEVLNIEYKDNSTSVTKPNARKIQELIKKFNRDPVVAAIEPARDDQKDQAKQCADAFVLELKANRVAAAYQMTTADYRRRVSEDQFTALAEQKRIEIEVTLMWDSRWAPGNTYRRIYTVGEFGPTHRCDVVMVKEGAAWKVDDFTFGPGITSGRG